MTAAESMARRAPSIGVVTCLLPYDRRDADVRRFAYQLELYAAPKPRQDARPYLRRVEFFAIDPIMQVAERGARTS